MFVRHDVAFHFLQKNREGKVTEKVLSREVAARWCLNPDHHLNHNPSEKRIKSMNKIKIRTLPAALLLHPLIRPQVIQALD